MIFNNGGKKNIGMERGKLWQGKKKSSLRTGKLRKTSGRDRKVEEIAPGVTWELGNRKHEVQTDKVENIRRLSSPRLDKSGGVQKRSNNIAQTPEPTTRKSLWGASAELRAGNQTNYIIKWSVERVRKKLYREPVMGGHQGIAEWGGSD